MTRADYIEKLNKLFRSEFKQSYKKHLTNIYDLLESRQPAALKHAAKLLIGLDPSTPESNCPSTTVHLLVEQLNRFKR